MHATHAGHPLVKAFQQRRSQRAQNRRWNRVLMAILFADIAMLSGFLIH